VPVGRCSEPPSPVGAEARKSPAARSARPRSGRLL